jgi:Icc-related predicted phosphoesterase
MKIHLASDIHIEFGVTDYHVPEETELLVLAGDIGVGTKGVDFAAMISDREQIPVVMVAGNHEFYNQRGLSENYFNIWEAAKNLGVDFLQDSSVEIKGVTFVGSTLWTDYALYDDANAHSISIHDAMKMCQYGMNDCKYCNVTPALLLDRHNTSVAYIKEECAKVFDKSKLVVVTHHAPSIQSVPPHHQMNGVEYNAGYASNLEDVIIECDPEFWFHGHMHDAAWYNVGRTQVASNPVGYVTQANDPNGYRSDFIVEV